MIKCEQFIYALFNGYGYKLLKTPNVEKRIGKTNLIRLIHAGDGEAKETIKAQWLPTEQVIAVSLIRPATDEYGRKGIWNHTILVNANDYFKLAPPEIFLRDHLIHPLAKPPERLEPILIESA